MKLIIDIPEEDYIRLRDEGMFGNVTTFKRAVREGTPLPKGHGRLIEVTNQLEQELFTFQRYTGIDEVPYESAIIIIDNAPTIIEADKEGDAE